MKRVHLAYPVALNDGELPTQVVCSKIPAGQKWERTLDHSKVTCQNCRCTELFRRTEPE